MQAKFSVACEQAQVNDRRAHGRRHGRETTVDPALMRVSEPQDHWFVVELPRSRSGHRAVARLVVPPGVLLTLAGPPPPRAGALIAVWLMASLVVAAPTIRSASR